MQLDDVGKWACFQNNFPNNQPTLDSTKFNGRAPSRRSYGAIGAMA